MGIVKMLVWFLLKTVDFYSVIILISVLLTWIDQRDQMQVSRFIKRITDPYLNLFKVIVPFGNSYFNLSPIIGIVILNLFRTIIVSIYNLIAG